MHPSVWSVSSGLACIASVCACACHGRIHMRFSLLVVMRPRSPCHCLVAVLSLRIIVGWGLRIQRGLRFLSSIAPCSAEAELHALAWLSEHEVKTMAGAAGTHAMDVQLRTVNPTRLVEHVHSLARLATPRNAEPQNPMFVS